MLRISHVRPCVHLHIPALLSWHQASKGHDTETAVNILCVRVCVQLAGSCLKEHREEKESSKWFQDGLKPCCRLHAIESLLLPGYIAAATHPHITDFPRSRKLNITDRRLHFSKKSNYSASPSFAWWCCSHPGGRTLGQDSAHTHQVLHRKKKKKGERWFAVGFSLSLYLDNGLTALQLQDSCEESTSLTYRLTSSWSYLEGKSSLGSHPWK